MAAVLSETLMKMEEPDSNLNDHNDNSDDDEDDHSGDEGDGKGKGKKSGGKSRRELPSGAVATLKAWLLSPEHFTHPYPTPQDQIMLMQKTGIDKKQLKNWFTNARRRIWKPMLKKQLEQGKLAQTGGGPGGAGSVTILSHQVGPPGTGVVMTQHPVHPGVQSDPSQFQQWQQPINAAHPFDASSGAAHTAQNYPYATHFSQQFTSQGQQPGMQLTQQGHNQHQQQHQQVVVTGNMNPSNSIGSLPPMNSFGSAGQMIKNDSHAVLMELFARDQDLVRQAAEGAKLKSQAGPQTQKLTTMQGNGTMSDKPEQSMKLNNATQQHPMQESVVGHRSSSGMMRSGAALNSWPHFSSVSSLNNLGSLAGVKSIQNLSAADLVNHVGKKGSLAQIKSQESMGHADSYAFLEVFFDNEVSNKRNPKRDREEDNDIGLSLDPDESSTGAKGPEIVSSITRPAALPRGDKDENEELKRNYDDALAARGLLSVSRSSEKLNEIPKKMQRTLSQEYLKQFASAGTSFTASQAWQQHSSDRKQPYEQQPEGQTAAVSLDQFDQGSSNSWSRPAELQSTTNADQGMPNDSVEVPVSTTCSICNQVNIDTQLLPCGHMFHGRCLKPSLQNAVGPPTCPVDNIPMHSAVLAVPTVNSNQISGSSS